MYEARAGSRAAVGDHAGAIADLSAALEAEPGRGQALFLSACARWLLLLLRRRGMTLTIPRAVQGPRSTLRSATWRRALLMSRVRACVLACTHVCFLRERRVTHARYRQTALRRDA